MKELVRTINKALNLYADIILGKLKYIDCFI